MNKTFKLYGIIFCVVLAVLVLLELGKSDVADWRKNFDVKEKTAFGLFIFDKEADFLFKNKLSRTEISPYDFYQNKTTKPHNILVVAKDIDEESGKRILNEVTKGADFMLVSEAVPQFLSDSLKFLSSQRSYEQKQTLYLNDVKLSNDSLVLDKLAGGKGFHVSEKNNKVLGEMFDGENDEIPNFIKIKFGKGNIYLHSEPLFLTNYYLLKPNSETYLQDVFSYLPDQETVWFLDSSQSISTSPMRFILSKPALRYAWWLFLAGLLLFVIFNAKRKQRIVPVIEPLKNKSVEFVKSVGNLYLQEGDFHDMMAKKAQYFLNKVRMDLMIDTQNLDENFAKKLQLKTGTSIEKIDEGIVLIKKSLDPYANVMKEDLIKMNKLLDEILK